jgi:hypothetical protein
VNRAFGCRSMTSIRAEERERLSTTNANVQTRRALADIARRERYSSCECSVIAS